MNIQTICSNIPSSVIRRCVVAVHKFMLSMYFYSADKSPFMLISGCVALKLLKQKKKVVLHQTNDALHLDRILCTMCSNLIGFFVLFELCSSM